jgi:hypothetical protein
MLRLLLLVVALFVLTGEPDHDAILGTALPTGANRGFSCGCPLDPCHSLIVCVVSRWAVILLTPLTSTDETQVLGSQGSSAVVVAVLCQGLQLRARSTATYVV